jgi:ADP-heptose:LPS heptosyltransferase
MKNILIINLRRYGDIISCAHLINSIRQADPSNKVSLLIYEEFYRVTSILKQVENVYTINRKEILSLYSNDIFSDGHAVENFYTSLKNVQDRQWHQIINYSNDNVSCHLTSYLTSIGSDIPYSGIKFTKDNLVAYSNQWAQIFNEIITTYPFTPIHFTDCYHYLTGYTYQKSCDVLAKSEDYETTVSNNFKQIRDGHRHIENGIKIIGLQLKTSDTKKDIPYDTLLKLIDFILDHPNYYPVLLIAPTAEERNYAESINKNFMNGLVTIESNFLASTSVISNLDLLITPDTSIKHIADLLGTPTIEVALGHAPFLKQGSVLQDNLIIRSTDGIDPQTIFNCINYYWNKESFTIHPPAGTTIYQSQRDELGIVYVPISEQNIFLDIDLVMSRKTLASIMGMDFKIPQRLFTYPLSQILEWAEEQKNAINDTTRALLGTLRSLLRIIDNSKMGEEFAQGLGKILAMAEEDYLCAIPTLLFKSKLETLAPARTKDNVHQIETLLYKFRDDLQIVLNCIREIEINIENIKKDRLVSRAVKNSHMETPETV